MDYPLVEKYEKAYVVDGPLGIIGKNVSADAYIRNRNKMGSDTFMKETPDKRAYMYYPLSRLRVGRSVDHIDPSLDEDID